MRKAPIIILLFIFCLFNCRLLAQSCYVSITNTNKILDCTNSTITLTTATKNTQAPVKYSWYKNNDFTIAIGSQQTLDITDSGNYTVVIKDAAGCTSTSSISVTKDISKPTVAIINNTGTTILTCTVQEINVTASGGSTYSWSNDVTTATNSFPLPGFYTVTATGANGCTNTADISISQDTAKPVASISNNTGTTILTCTTPLIKVTATGGIGYAWSNDVTTASNSFSAPGTYKVTVIGTNGCSAGASINITQDTVKPFVGIDNNAGTTVLTCVTTSISVIATGGVSYSWSTGAKTAANSFSLPGIYIVTATGANGCTDAAGITIAQDITKPVAGIINNTGTAVLTCTIPSIEVTATGGISYLWSTGATTATTDFASPGIFSVTVTGPNGCTNSAGIAITQDTTKPIAVITNNTGTTVLNCTITSISVTATGGASYEWSTGAKTATTNISSPDIYTVTVTGATGCSSKAGISITQDITKPVVVISNNTGSSVLTCNTTLINVTASGGSSYLWNGGATPTSVENKFSLPGTYTVTVTGANGCYAKDSISITQNSSLPNPAIGIGNSRCGTGTVNISATCGPGETIDWYQSATGGAVLDGGIGTLSFTTPGISATTIFYAQVRNIATGCVSSTRTGVTAIVNELPFIVIQPSNAAQTICFNENAEPLSLSASGTALSYQWYSNTIASNEAGIKIDGANSNSYTPLTSVTGTGFYYCVVSGACAPPVHSAVSGPIKVAPLPTGTMSGDKESVCLNEAATITFTGTTGVEPYTFFYAINAGALQSITTVDGSTATISAQTGLKGNLNYQLIAILDGNGCSQDQTGTTTIAVLSGPTLTSNKSLSVCDGVLFDYTATSSDLETNFSWNREAVDGISNAEASGTDSVISETLHNTTSQPIVVKYVFQLFTGKGGCVTIDTLRVVVNPTPKTDPISDTTFCNGFLVDQGINFSSRSPNASFAWTCNPTVGFGLTGGGNIPVFNATNTGNSTIEAKVNVQITAGTDHCPGPGTSFMIRVLPTPELTSARTVNICDDSVFLYTAKSSTSGTETTYRWERAKVDGIDNPAGSGTGAEVNEILHNTTDQPIVVKYAFVLSTGRGCATADSVMVTVNPTPVINSIRDTAFCAGVSVDGINFSSSSPNASFAWSASDDFGLGTDTTAGNIGSFVARNDGTARIDSRVKVYVTASTCKGLNTNFTITVLPKAQLKGSSKQTVCDSALFAYTASSPVTGVSFAWKRDLVPGISNPARANVSGNNISEYLNNATDQPKVAKYIFTLSQINGCVNNDSIQVKVNPTASVSPIEDLVYCNQDKANGIFFSSSSPDSAFKWTCNPAIGFGTGGDGSIKAFPASNPGTIPVNALVTVFPSSDKCPGDSSSFKITVNPSAGIPNFTSIVADYQTLVLCNGSENISFNVNDTVEGTDYRWTSLTTGRDSIYIKDSNDANTVISFLKPGSYTINAQAINTANGGCSSTVSQQVRIEATDGIVERKIFKKQPGSLLVYPDNSLRSYQWGYDSVISTSPDSTFGPSVPVPGQVYQFFTPDKKFINAGGDLNETNYVYWVSLQNGNCFSKVYYNGPYANDKLVVVPITAAPKLLVTPNPNNGFFEVILTGNIYGNIRAKVYNAVGQVVYLKSFDKFTQTVNEKFSTGNLAAGFYFIELYSSDLKKVSSRFLIQH